MSKCVCGLYDDQPCTREVCRRPVLGRYTAPPIPPAETDLKAALERVTREAFVGRSRIALPTDGPKPVSFDWGDYACEPDPNRPPRTLTIINAGDPYTGLPASEVPEVYRWKTVESVLGR